MNIPSLYFGGSSSAVVDFGSPTVLDNLFMNKGTIIAIAYRDSWANFTGGSLFRKNTVNTFQFTWGAGSPPDFQILLDRATTDLRAQTNATSFPVIGANKWVFAAATFDINGASTDQKLYAGDERTPLSEPSSYSTQTAGSGTVTDTSGNNLLIGNVSALNAPEPGKIVFVGAWTQLLSQADIRNQCNAIWRWIQGIDINPLLWPGCILASHLGRHGNSVALDVSGWNSNGTPSNVTTSEIESQPVWIKTI